MLLLRFAPYRATIGLCPSCHLLKYDCLFLQSMYSIYIYIACLSIRDFSSSEVVDPSAFRALLFYSIDRRMIHFSPGKKHSLRPIKEPLFRITQLYPLQVFLSLFFFRFTFFFYKLISLSREQKKKKKKVHLICISVDYDPT